LISYCSLVEKQHEVKLDEVVQRYKDKIERLEVSETQHKTEARELRQQCDELARAKKEEEKRRDQVL
jgi:prefoldin subunit 5